jgi:hypothetical protein
VLSAAVDIAGVSLIIYDNNTSKLTSARFRDFVFL